MICGCVSLCSAAVKVLLAKAEELNRFVRPIQDNAFGRFFQERARGAEVGRFTAVDKEAA